jgi:hypothetical protein
MTDFGYDTSCTDELRTGRFASGKRLVAEAIYRRLITRKGELLDSLDYGFMLEEYLGAVTSAAEIAALPDLIRQQILRDDRLLSADVVVEETSLGPERRWDVTIGAYTAEGPFELVIAVGDVTTALVGFKET